MMVAISTLFFVNGFGLFFMWITKDCRHIASRTERELQILKKENELN